MANYRYHLDKRLIVVPVRLIGPESYFKSVFILDTGASYTILDHSIADVLGYSARDASGLSTVTSAAGRERGYRLVIKGIETLGKPYTNIEVACHDLKDQGVEGFIGMDFLARFDWCVHPEQQIISIE